jgi:hypothetical protein
MTPSEIGLALLALVVVGLAIAAIWVTWKTRNDHDIE